MQPAVEQTVEPEKSAELAERTDEMDVSQQSSTEEPGEPLSIQNPEEVVPVQEQEPTLSPAAETAAAQDEPPLEYAEEVAEPPQKRFSRNGILTVLLLIAAVALLVFYFWQHRRNPSQKKLVQEEVLQPVEEPSDPPYTDAPTTIDATEPERVPSSDLAPDDPRSLLRDGKIADAASSWSDTLSENGKSYSIQLVIACQEKTVIDTHSMLNYSEQMIVLPISYKGQNCYRVLFGQYSSRNAAQAAIQDLPEVFIRQSSPASVVSMAKVLP
jgi:septal ring-binding cell division protein DamX